VKHYLYLLETTLEKHHKEKQDFIAKLESLETTQTQFKDSEELVESLQKHVHDLQGIAADRDQIKSQYEKLTKEFEQKTNTLQDEKTQLEINKANIEEQYITIIKEKTAVEFKLEDAKRHTAETSKEFEMNIEVLKGEIKASKDIFMCIDKEKQSLQNNIDTLKQEKQNNTISINDLEDSKAEIEELKKKLNLALTNAKQLEKEASELDSLLLAAEEDKKSLSETNSKLNRQIASVKEEIKNFNLEAEKSIKNPWEGEEWEGLTVCEIYDMMKHDLVPAQQARLSKLCVEELEKQLQENKNILMKVLAEKEELVNVKTKLDAKVCFLENSSSESLSESKENSTLDESKTSTSKITKRVSSENDTAEASIQTPANSRSLRRSSRSASKIANMSLLKMPNPQLEDVKRSANTIETEDEVEKRLKVKTTDTESPAKVVRVPKKQGLIQPSKLAAKPGVDERDPLSCVTNSPSKASQPDISLGSSRGPAFRQNSLRGRKKNPEECKQQ